MKKVIYSDHNGATLKEVLAKLEMKFDVKVCKSGLEVMTELGKDEIDLALVDLELTEGVAGSVFPVFKRNSINKDVVLLALDCTEKNHLERSLSSDLPEGIDGVIYRPFEASEMVLEISLALAKSESNSIKENQKPKCQSPKSKGKELPAENIENHQINDLPVKRIRNYQIIDLLEKCGDSSVYLAIDNNKKNGKKIALKLFKPPSYRILESSQDAFFLREIYGLSKLNHPNVVEMLDFGKFKDSYYLAVEYINGENLENIIKNRGPLDESQLILIAGQIASVLLYLEKENIVHRDIKPSNIFAKSFDQIKLTGFGSAKNCGDNSLTQNSGFFRVFPQFISPEQIQGKMDVDISCDVYALGATLYYCGTNLMLFSGKTPREILDKNMNENPEPMHEINSEISEEFSQLVEKLLSKNKTERPTPTELIEILSIEG